MTDELPDAVETAFDRHEAFERAGDGYVVATTAFEGRVTAVATPDLFALPSTPTKGPLWWRTRSGV
jgi:hypothetical protein